MLDHPTIIRIGRTRFQIASVLCVIIACFFLFKSYHSWGKSHPIIGSSRPYSILSSISNPYGTINLIDPYSGSVFNPAVLPLPTTVALESRILLTARGPEQVIPYDDGTDSKRETRNQFVKSCYLLPIKRKVLNLPLMARESEIWDLDLPGDRKLAFQRCDDPIMEQFVGPEDPRLLFTPDGQPLLFFSQSGRSPHICRAINIIDARVVVPNLADVLKKGGWNPPIIFDKQTELIREGQYNIEKNWAPFNGWPEKGKTRLYMHVNLVPQLIYPYVSDLTLRPIQNSIPPSHNCLSTLIGADLNRVRLHHATPLLKVTYCNANPNRWPDCVPTIHNTVLFGIVHVKYYPEPYLFYERRVVTWNVTSPFEYISVGKPLTYVGTNQGDPIFTVNMAWSNPQDRHGLGLDHGYLDETLIVSFGVYDYGSAYIDGTLYQLTSVTANDLLQEHQYCG